MGMLDISTGLLKQLPEKPLLSRSGSTADIDAARRQSLLALGGSAGGIGSSSLSNMSGLSEMGGSYSGFPSADVSGVQSPRSLGSDSSDDGMYGNFSATAGMAGLE